MTTNSLLWDVKNHLTDAMIDASLKNPALFNT